MRIKIENVRGKDGKGRPEQKKWAMFGCVLYQLICLVQYLVQSCFGTYVGVGNTVYSKSGFLISREFPFVTIILLKTVLDFSG